MVKRAERRNLNNILFSIFWWFVQKISPKKGERLLYWGLESGAFPNKSHEDPILANDVMGLHFQTPVGIGSGFDVGGNVIDDLIFMGAGFGEFGPYTLEPEKHTTETFYLRRDKAILKQTLGCQNIGVNNILPALINRRYLPNLISVNLTITAESEGENVKMGRVMTYAEEFDIMVRKVAPYTDMITLDFSHPEVELSRIIADRSVMIPLLQNLKHAAAEAAPIHPPKLLIKIPLGLTPMEVPLVCESLITGGVDGVIVAGPLSLSMHKVRLSKNHTAGMISGMPVKPYIVDLISKVRQFTKGNLPIIACGGVFSGIDAYEVIAAGASLIELGTVLRFDGPNAVTKINRELATILRRKGIDTVAKAVGIDFY